MKMHLKKRLVTTKFDELNVVPKRWSETALLALFVSVVFTTANVTAQDFSLDASVRLIEGPAVPSPPGSIGFITLEVTNLGPVAGRLLLTINFGLESQIPVTLFDEHFDISPAPETRPSCDVVLGIANPTPLVAYSLRPAPFSRLMEPGETRTCRIRYDVNPNAPTGSYPIELVADVASEPTWVDPDESNNTVNLAWEVGTVDAVGLPMLSTAALVLLVLVLSLSPWIFTTRIKEKPRN